MQLDVLRRLCGPEVKILMPPFTGSVPDEAEEILVLDLDDPKCTVIVEGPVGSLDRLIRALEAE